MPECTLAILGQSNGTQMCVVPVAGCDPVPGTYVKAPGGWRAMTSSDGAGMIEIANALRATGYDSVCVYNCTSGGSSIVPQAASPALNCWHNASAGSPLTDCLAQVAAGGKKPQVVIWTQGEQEALYSQINPGFDMATAYKLCLGQLRDHLLNQWGTTADECLWMVTPVGYTSYGNQTYVRQAQTQYATSTYGVLLGPSREDLPLLNEGGTLVHLTGPACRTFAARIVPMLLEVLAVTDPQDKAAIAALLVAVAALQAAQATRDAELAANLAQIQTAINNLCAGLGALESLSPSAVNWPIEWAC